jgi:tetratricopeptide (TPR) repeat protein
MRTTAGVVLALGLLAVPALADKKLDDAVAKAEEQLQKGRPDEALKGLQRAVQGSPSVEGWLALSRFQERLGNLDEAAKSAAAAVGVATTPAAKAEALAAQSSLALLTASGKDAHTQAQEAAAGGTPAGLAALARAQVRVGDAQAALQSAEKAIAAGATSAAAHEAKGEALLALGRKDEAIAAYRKSLELDPKLSRARIGLASSLSAAGQHAEAVAEAKKVTAAEEKNAEAFAALGLALLAQNPTNWNAAIAEAQQGAFLNAKSVNVQLAVGRIFESAGNLDQAAAAYERAVQQDPGLSGLRARLLNLKYPVGRVQQKYVQAKKASKEGGLELSKQVLTKDEGYQQLVKLAAEQPKNGDLQYQLGLYHLYVEDYKGAAEALQKATQLSPALAPAWAYLGTAQQYLGRTPEAVAAYKKAVELDPGSVPFRSTYGLLACVAGEHATGIAELVKVTATPGYKDSAGFTNLGWCYRNATPKRTKEAVDAYRRALELDPKNEQAALGMGWAYSYQQSYDEAIEAFQKAAQIDPSVTAEAMNGAAWCYFFKGDMAKALETLDKAQAAGRADTRLRENIAKLEKLKAQREEYEKYKKQLEEERAKGPDVSTLCRQAGGGDAGSKIRAIRALGDAGREAIPCLIRALDDVPSVRGAAAAELGGMGPQAKQAVPYLMEVARSECQKTIMTAEEMKASVPCEDARRNARDAIGKINR